MRSLLLWICSLVNCLLNLLTLLNQLIQIFMVQLRRHVVLLDSREKYLSISRRSVKLNVINLRYFIVIFNVRTFIAAIQLFGRQTVYLIFDLVDPFL